MTDIEQERARIEQSNDVAGIVFDQIKRVWPDLHPVLDLRYGIADELWDAGYRKPAPATRETVTADDITDDAADRAHVAYRDFTWGADDRLTKRYLGVARRAWKVAIAAALTEKGDDRGTHGER